MGREGGRLTAVLTNVLYFLGPAFAPFQTQEEGGRPPLIMAALVYAGFPPPLIRREGGEWKNWEGRTEGRRKVLVSTSR